jgi:hypothetical protein
MYFYLLFHAEESKSKREKIRSEDLIKGIKVQRQHQNGFVVLIRVFRRRRDGKWGWGFAAVKFIRNLLKDKLFIKKINK